MSIPYILTDKSVTFLLDNGKNTYQVSRDSITFGDVLAELGKYDADEALLIDLARPIVKIEREITLAFESAPNVQNYLAKRTVEVTRAGVLLDGVPMAGVLVDRMMETLSAGLPLGGLIRFMENLYMNPSETARDELYLWLENSTLPITEDGHFLAYKRVKDDFFDEYSGTFDNSPGQVVQLAGRHAVDPIRDNLCSRGLHFCSLGYLPSYGLSGGGVRVVLLKINPADVVSIPSDYNNAKGRTWRYEVLSEVDGDLIHSTKFAPLVSDDGGDYDPRISEYVDTFGNDIYIEGPDDDGEHYWRIENMVDYAEGYAPDRAAARSAAYEASAGLAAEADEEEHEDDEDDPTVWTY